MTEEELKQLLEPKLYSEMPKKGDLLNLLAQAQEPKKQTVPSQQTQNNLPIIPSNISYSLATNLQTDPELKEYRKQLLQEAANRLEASKPLLQESQNLYQETKNRQPDLARYFNTANFARIEGLTPEQIAKQLKPIEPMDETTKTEALRQLLGQAISGENSAIQNIGSLIKGADDSSLARFLASQQLRENKDTDAIYKDVRKSYEPIVNDSYEQIKLFSNLKQALDSGNLQSINSILSQLVRLQGEKGALTEGDIARGLTQTMKNRVKNWVGNVMLGMDVNADPVVVKMIRQNLNYIVKSSLDKAKGRLGVQKSMFDVGSPTYSHFGTTLYNATIRDWENAVKQAGFDPSGEMEKPAKRKKL